MAVEKCGCKGIRTCLLCEKQSNVPAISHETEENRYSFSYCSGCNLCWTNDEITASAYDFPLYLGKIKLFPEFCTEEEESTIISFIDEIPWVLSQSGRRKQDFGPKVNFKKKKVKIGDFKGFPKFTENIIGKFQGFPELSDFDPVELCNLEYTPERGSSIDPHVDDFWLWGERLVTINLSSPTVLTLVPCSKTVCECFQEANCNYFQQSNEISSCKHLLKNGSFIKHSSTESELINEKINSICNLFRTSSKDSKVCIQIVLPPRSLFVLSGCARYNWFHEIKRQDIASRRLAMTFRELSPEFLNEGKENQFGKDLLLTAKNFYDL